MMGLFLLSLGIFGHIFYSKISHRNSFKFILLIFTTMSNKIRFLIRGAVVEWLERLAVVQKVAGFESCLGRMTEKLSLFSRQRMGTWFTSGKVKGGERRGLGPALHMLCPRHDRALTTHCPDGH